MHREASSSLAPRRVPEAYLRAEIAAFPLVGEEAFHQVVLSLDPHLEAGSTQALWRACEQLLLQHTGWSLDRLVSARDRTWFGVDDKALTGRLPPVSMLAYLRALAGAHLQKRPGVTAIEDSSDASAIDAELHYRWLTFALPEDLLCAALGVDPAPTRVDVDPPLLVRRLLDRGVAEIHQHVGAGMDFPLLWASALAALATPAVADTALAGPGAPFSSGRWLIRWMLAAAVARCVLAEYLGAHAGQSAAHGLADFIEQKTARDDHPAWTPTRRATLAAVIQALATGREERLPEISPLRDLYADLHPTARTLGDDPIKNIEDAYQRCDPVAARFGLRGESAGERWLLRAAFLHLDRQRAARAEEDELFARLFWQTLRVRCQYYRSIVERPLTAGLQWFIRFYDRIGPLRRPIDRIRPEASYRVAASGEPIAALEIRTGAGGSSIEIAEELADFVRSWRDVVTRAGAAPSEPEMGVLLHFIKTRDGGARWSRGAPPAFWAGTHAEPQPKGESRASLDAQHGRYVGFFSRQAQKARAIADLIRDVPSCLWVLRGLDVASDELGVPTWVLVPLFRHVTQQSAAMSVRPGAGKPLRLTAHVGEDFRHLMEGMRRIYEQVYYVLGADGGRLGHAVALGVDAQGWGESVGSVLYPAEERLWDLVFEWRLYSRHRVRPEFAAAAPAGRAEQLENMVRDVSTLVFGRAYEAHELAEAHHTLHRFLVPPLVKEPIVDGGLDTFTRGLALLDWSRVRFAPKVRRIMKAYFEDERVFRRGQSLIDIPIDAAEVAALKAVQWALRRGVGQRGVVVEVNPSSNLLIGDLLDLRHHPILRLFPPEPEPDAPPPVPIALGSDDPVTFSTRLLREYTLLYQAACAAGYPERTVLEWLEAIRRTGMDARFTLSWRPSVEARAGDLLRDLKRYLREPEAR